MNKEKPTPTLTDRLFEQELSRITDYEGNLVGYSMTRRTMANALYTVTRMVADAEQRGRESQVPLEADNHHNATVCPYCTSDVGRLVDQGRTEVSAAVEAALQGGVARTSGGDGKVVSVHQVRAALTDPAAAVARIKEQAWDEAVRECHDLGWMHDYALSDVLARNPYRGGDDQ